MIVDLPAECRGKQHQRTFVSIRLFLFIKIAQNTFAIIKLCILLLKHHFTFMAQMPKKLFSFLLPSVCPLAGLREKF